MTRFLPTTIFSKPHFGLSFTQSAIRAVITDSRSQVQLTLEEALEPGVFAPDKLDQSKLAVSLQNLLSQSKLSSPYAAVTIPEYYSFSRSHTLPNLKLEDVSEALTWQIEKIFPLPKDQIYFDWKLVSQTNKQLEIIIVAVHRRTLDDLLTVLEAAQIKPISFEPSASALTRILPHQANQASILVEINPFGSSSSLVSNNLSNLTVTNRFAIGAASDTKAALQATSQSIQSLLNHFKTHHDTDTTISQILLTGDSASEQLAQWLSSYTNQTVVLVDIPSVPSYFHQAYAAATYVVEPPHSGRTINLLPEKLQTVFEAQRRQHTLTSKLSLAIGLLAISILISAFSLTAIFFSLYQAGNELSQLAVAGENYKYNANQISSVNNASNLIVKHFPAKTTPVEALTALESLIPPGLKITSIQYQATDQNLLIAGQAQDRATLVAFRDNLASAPQFSQVDVPLDSLGQQFNVTFNLTLQLAPLNHGQ